jgi:hypothetical protein
MTNRAPSAAPLIWDVFVAPPVPISSEDLPPGT